MRKVLVAVSAACLLFLCITAQVAQAKGILICNADGKGCVPAASESLQDAINAAGRGSLIHVTNGVYTEHNIQIKKNITIRGDGLQTIIEANAQPCLGTGRTITETERVFAIFGSMVTMENLTIRNGCALGGTDDAQGGGIWSAGDVTLNHVLLQGNAAMVSSSNALDSGPIVGLALGGAIYNGGNLRIENSTILSNTVTAETNGAFGGGIYNNGTTTLINSTIGGNQAKEYRLGGGILVGGGVFSSGRMFTAEYNSFVDNFATIAAGGLGADGPVKLINNLFYHNVSIGGVGDCIEVEPSDPTEGAAKYVNAPPCDIPRPPNVQLEVISGATGTPVYRPVVSVENLSGSLNVADCRLSAVRVDQLGNLRGLGGNCDLGAVEAAMSFMPTLWSAPAKPDLRIKSVTIDPPPGQITAGTKVMITVVVENIGNLATTGRFFVDMAINPQVTPANKAGHTWMDFCKSPGCEGVIWNAPPTIIEDGGIYPLWTDLENEYVVRISSQFDRYLPAGPVDIWVYADSWDKTLSATGLIDELTETNNQYHYPTFTVKPGRILPAEANQQATAAGQQPETRPVPPTYEP